VRLTEATSRAEREAAIDMVVDLPGKKRRTLGADKAYDVKLFVDVMRICSTTPHIAAKKAGYSALDGRTTRHPGYLLSQRKRKRVEEIFGWLKMIGLLRKTRHRGVARVGWMSTFGLAVYNLVRIRRLVAQPT